MINRQDAIVSVALEIWHYPNELYTSLNCFENCQELAERALNHLPSAEPEKVLVAEVKLSQEQIQDAVDKAVEKMKAELEPCDFCKHKDDCGDMALYCPSERRTDE